MLVISVRLVRKGEESRWLFEFSAVQHNEILLKVQNKISELLIIIFKTSQMLRVIPDDYGKHTHTHIYMCIYNHT